MFLRVILALSIVMAPAHADDSVIPVFMDGIIVKVPNFPGMVQLPAHTHYDEVYDTLTPSGAEPMRQSIPAELLTHDYLPYGESETLAQLMRLKSKPGDVDDAAFLRVLDLVKSKIQMPAPRSSSDGGLGVQSIIFESGDALSVLTTRNFMVQSPNNRIEPMQSYSVMSYLHIKNRLLIAVILRVNSKLGPPDLDDLKATIALYVDNLRRLNKS